MSRLKKFFSRLFNMNPSEIIENLFIGNLANSATFDGAVVCVLEWRETYGKNATWIPIMKHIPTSNPEVTTYMADEKQLNVAAEAIESLLSANKKVMVHCAVGMERSPLVVAWYLHTKKGMSLDEAYSLIISRRSFVQRRDEWLPKVVINTT